MTTPHAFARLILLLLAPLAFGACSPKYYAPNTHNVPLLTRDGDFGVLAAVGDSRGELQGSYALTNRLGVLLNVAAFDKRDDAEGDGGSGGLVEVGFGYTMPIDENAYFGVFGLVGGGNLENHFPSTVASNPGTTGDIEAKLTRFGVQPMIGFTSRYFEAIGSVRLLGLRYSDVTGSLVFAGEDQVQVLSNQADHTLLEPAITLRGGWETWKLQLQMGWSANKSYGDFRQDEGFLTLGVAYSPN
jgi:hypothetical protein